MILLALLGCTKSDDNTPNDGALAVTTADGVWTAANAASGSHADLPIVPGIPNLDDDDGDGTVDWEQGRSDDNELATFSYVAAHKTRLSFDNEGYPVRVWKDGNVVLNDDLTTLDLGAASGQPIELQVEFGDYLAKAHLTFTDTVNGDSVEVLLQGAPLILNHHLQPSELVTAMNVNSSWGDNADMIAGFEDALPEGVFLEVKQGPYSGDVWVQDEIEFGSLTADGQRMDLVVDSIRNGQGQSGAGLDDLAEDEFEGPDFVLGEWGSGRATSQDSFGNLEITPPVEGYPFGRIYYGSNGGRMAPADGLIEFLESQQVQDPFVLDATWLCVGHVDEYQTFVPDSTSDKGFKLVWSDVNLAYEILEGMDAETTLPRYRADYSFRTVGAILEDDGLRKYNEEVQEDYLEPQLEEFKAELGLTDDDVILIPALFEELSWCGNTGIALIPGMANLIVAEDAAGQTTLFVPDPFVREDESDVSTDPIAMAFTNAMPSELRVEFLDAWDVYHLGMGEVHCGTNVIRTPDDSASWWLDARHLISE